MDFTHIILTRFNVPTKNWSITREGSKALSEKWLEDRFEIFEKYCLPSFRNQKNKNFIWIIFFDVNTPEKHLRKIEEIKKDFTIFNPVFFKDSEEMHEKIVDITTSFINKESSFVITTDIDNDDLLHQDFVKTVQENFQPKHNMVIDLVKGLQVTKNLTNEATVNEFYMIANPFVSLVESVDSIGTIMKEKHLSYRNYPNYVSYDKEPLFIQFIHENNLVNDTISHAKQIANINFSDYGIAKENHFKISSLNAFFSNMSRKLKTVKQIIIPEKQ